jgi:nucleoside-diphosphate-sugar epimerase
MSDTVAVTGATGRIGAPLVAALLRDGRRVRALSRRQQPGQPGLEWVIGDVCDPAAVAALVEGASIVFHAGGQLDGPPDAVERSLVEGTANVLRSATRARVVHVSSLVVLDTASVKSPVVIDEDAPLEQDPGRRGVYTRAKCAAEALARAAAQEQDVVIVRPGLVVGKAPEPIPLSIGLRVGRFLLLVGPAEALLPVVHANDVAAGLICAAMRSDRGGVLHLIDPTPVSRGQLLQRLDSGNDRIVTLPTGDIAPALARLLVLSRVPRLSNAAYRLLSAGRPHRWTAQRAIDLGWHPGMLAEWPGN